MKLDFDLKQVTHVEFGVGLDVEGDQQFRLVPSEDAVQEALLDMVRETRAKMRRTADEAEEYNPAEKHAGTEYLFLALQDGLAALLRELHNAKNLRHDADVLSEPEYLFAYFVRMKDKLGKRLTALRRSTQFKGVLKHRLLRFRSDALRIIKDEVFKLDMDFDVLVDNHYVHILRPSGFEFACRLQDAVLEAVTENVKDIQTGVDYVDFSEIEAYARKHPRAARYLASICSQSTNVDKARLKKQCAQTGVILTENNGKLEVEPEHIMGFLEVLDRRRYELELVKDKPERFRASARKRITK